MGTALDVIIFGTTPDRRGRPTRTVEVGPVRLAVASWQ